MNGVRRGGTSGTCIKTRAAECGGTSKSVEEVARTNSTKGSEVGGTEKAMVPRMHMVSHCWNIFSLYRGEPTI